MQVRTSKLAAFLANFVHTGFPSKTSQQLSLDNPVHLRKWSSSGYGATAVKWWVALGRGFQTFRREPIERQSKRKVRTFVAVVAENNADLRPKQVHTIPVEAPTLSTRHKFSRTIWEKLKLNLLRDRESPNFEVMEQTETENLLL